MDPLEIIDAVCQPGSKAHHILVDHGNSVAEKALKAVSAVSHLNPDLDFIYQAAMLHDIGMVFTDTPQLGCFGRYPYICHGVLGRDLLEERGFPAHGLVCERHVGVGITVEDIARQALPLPHRDMRPQSIEEQAICYADKFFSKAGSTNGREKAPEEILQKLDRYGPGKAEQFKIWLKMFSHTARGRQWLGGE